MTDTSGYLGFKPAPEAPLVERVEFKAPWAVIVPEKASSAVAGKAIGPFYNFGEAEEYAKLHYNEHWFIVPMLVLDEHGQPAQPRVLSLPPREGAPARPA